MFVRLFVPNKMFGETDSVSDLNSFKSQPPF